MLRTASTLPPVLLLVTFIPFTAAAGAHWTPISDEPYLQEVGYQAPTDSRIWSVGVLGEAVYAGFGEGVMQLKDRARFEPAPGSPEGPIVRMETAGEALWVFTKKGLFRLTEAGWTAMGEGEFVDVCEYRGDVIVAAPGALYRVEGDMLAPLPNAAPTPGPIQGIDSYAETLYCLGYDRLITFDGKEYVHRKVAEFGALPSKDLRDLLSFGSRLIVATHQGLGVLRGTAATAVLAADGLPYEETKALAMGFADDYWIATTGGAIRVVDGDFHFFTGPRWLPDNWVNAIACGAHTAYIATNAGLGIIDYEPYTLLKKAAYYERHLEEWGQKRMAFVHKLEWSPDKGGWVREVSDNDVGWSTHYWAAKAFKYAVTGDAQARQNAVDGFNAMKWSEEITPIDGFPARSIWAVGETGNRTTGGSGGYPAEWNPTPDGKWDWKGDTSSDETDAHFYYASIFYELAANEAEKEQVRDHLTRVSGHIMDNGWVLRDLDGKPTVWARWDPEYFAGKGKYARGLNGLEILNYMRTTYAITGNEKFKDGLQQLLDMNYLEKVIVQKIVFPADIFHSDDRLAFYNYYTLLQYETDPDLRSYYMRSLERSYEIERIEHIPWFNFIYGALTGHDCEVEEAAAHLREWPLDMVQYSFDFGNRADLENTPRGYIPYCQVTRPFSPRERGATRWTANQGVDKGASNAKEVEDPSGWLDAYWMGRYYGFILPPETDDPALTTVPPRGLRLGAVPYDGPPMPNVLAD